MGITELIDKALDPYERKARLWPALLAGLPAFALIGIIYASQAGLVQQVIMLTASCGGLYLLASICRHMGKSLEPQLYESWGGKPTTQILRHRDPTIERVTKLRYHNFLVSKIGVPFPDSRFETRDPKAADEVYQSGVRWLLNQTRDAKVFGLLLQENIAYGFRRNALAVKPVALAIAIASLVWVLAAQGVIAGDKPSFVDVAALHSMTIPAWVCLGIPALMIPVWTLFVSKASVREAAFTYAETLLRACDVLSPSTSNKLLLQ